MKIGTFKKPPFQAPAVPPMPSSLVAAKSAALQLIATIGAVPKLPSIFPNPLAIVNTQLTALAGQQQAAAQKVAKAKLNALRPPSALPSGLGVPALPLPTNVDEFGKALGAEIDIG